MGVINLKIKTAMCVLYAHYFNIIPPAPRYHYTACAHLLIGVNNKKE